MKTRFVAKQLREMGADDNCIEVIQQWGQEPDKDEELVSIYTYRLRHVVEKLQTLLTTDPNNSQKIERLLALLKRILSPERVELVDSMFAATTTRQD